MTEAATPRVFISHGSEDKDRFVLGFATQLLERGIDAWIDQWEIVLGDSLVQRIFSIGIAGADAFIVILSSTSVNKSWVQAELDAAVVRNIEDNTRLIVIRLDDVEVPTALRAKKWITIRDLASYDDEVQEVINAIFGNSTKPPLGAPLRYATLPLIGRLNAQDSAVLRVLVEDAIQADLDVAMSSELLNRAEEVGIDEAAFNVSLSPLKRAFLVDYSETFGGYRTPAELKQAAWRQVLPSMYPNLASKRKELIGLLVNKYPHGASSDDLAEQLDLPRRVVIFFIRELDASGLVTKFEAMPNICGAMNVNVPLLEREL